MQQVWEASTWLEVKHVIAANHTSAAHCLSSCSVLSMKVFHLQRHLGLVSLDESIQSGMCTRELAHTARDQAAGGCVQQWVSQVYNSGMLSTAMACVSVSLQIMHGKHTSLGIQARLPYT